VAFFVSEIRTGAPREVFVPQVVAPVLGLIIRVAFGHLGFGRFVAPLAVFVLTAVFFLVVHSLDVHSFNFHLLTVILCFEVHSLDVRFLFVLFINIHSLDVVFLVVLFFVFLFVSFFLFVFFLSAFLGIVGHFHVYALTHVAAGSQADLVLAPLLGCAVSPTVRVQVIILD